MDLDLAFLEQRPDRPARASPEDAEHGFLWGDECELDPRDAAALEEGRGHQGELVEWKRPDQAAGNSEHDVLRSSAAKLLKQLPEWPAIGLAGEGEGAGKRSDLAEVEAARVAELERFGHQQRAIGEIALRREQLQVHALLGQVAQG